MCTSASVVIPGNRHCTLAKPFRLYPPKLRVHELDSSASNYMVRSPLSHSVDPSAWSLVRGTSCQLALSKFWASTCAHLKCMCSFKFLVYGHTQTDIHTYTHVFQCNHVSVGLDQARPNKIYTLKKIVLDSWLLDNGRLRKLTTWILQVRSYFQLDITASS